jgi:hypothetical protein
MAYHPWPFFQPSRFHQRFGQQLGGTRYEASAPGKDAFQPVGQTEVATDLYFVVAIDEVRRSMKAHHARRTRKRPDSKSFGHPFRRLDDVGGNAE